MKTYRHRDRAGNVADVWKHALLLQVLSRVVRRIPAGRPSFHYFESHSGPGCHPLEPGRSWTTGVGSLFAGTSAHLSSAVRDSPYLLGVEPHISGLRYPSSWVQVGERLEREGRPFRMTLCDVAPEVVREVRSAGTMLGWELHALACEGLSAAPRCAPWDLALIDPPYHPEPGPDFAAVRTRLDRLSAHGVPSLIWYPLIKGSREDLSPPPGGAAVELRREGRSSGRMIGCGLLAGPELAADLIADREVHEELAGCLGGRVEYRGLPLANRRGR